MGANNKRDILLNIKARLEGDDAKREAKALGKDITKILEDMGSDAFHLKEPIHYMRILDKMMDAFKAEHGDDFEKMFDGLGADLLKGMEELFQTTKKELDVVDQLNDRIARAQAKIPEKGIKALGKSDVDALDQEARAIQVIMDDLYKTLGREMPTISPRLGAEKRLAKMKELLGDFGVTWEDVSKKVSQGFHFGTGGGGSSPGDAIEDELEEMARSVKKGIEDLDKQITDLKKKKEELNKVLTDNKKYSGKVDLDTKSVREMVDEYHRLSDAMKNSNKDSDEYHDALLKSIELSTKLNAVSRELRSKDKDGNYKNADARAEFIKATYFEDKERGLRTALLGAVGEIAGDDPYKKFIRDVAQTKLEAYGNRIVSTQDELNDLKITEKRIAKNKELGLSYKTIAKYASEYMDINSKYDEDGNLPKADKERQKQIEKELKQLAKAKGLAQKSVTEVLEDVSIADTDDMYHQLCKTLGVDIPKNAQKAEDALKSVNRAASSSGDGTGAGTGTGTGEGTGIGDGTGSKVSDEALASLESVIKSEIQSILNKMGESDISQLTDGIKQEISSLAEKLDFSTLEDVIRNELNSTNSNIDEAANRIVTAIKSDDKEIDGPKPKPDELSLIEQRAQEAASFLKNNSENDVRQALERSGAQDIDKIIARAKELNGVVEDIKDNSNQYVKELDKLSDDPSSLKDEEEVNRVYQERLALIQKMGSEEFNALDKETREDIESTNKEYQMYLDDCKSFRDDDIYYKLDEEYTYDNRNYQSAAELETLLTNREKLLEGINFKQEDYYQEELATNQAIKDRIGLMKELESQISKGKISQSDLEDMVYEKGTLDERKEMLDAVQGDLFNLDDGDIDEAQAVLDKYEKIMVTTASGKKLELGPNMSEADYKSFMKIDTDKAKSIEFLRQEKQALEDVESQAHETAAAVDKVDNNLNIDNVVEELQRQAKAEQYHRQALGERDRVELDGFNRFNPTEDWRRQILDYAQEYRQILSQISDIPIIETDDDLQRLSKLVSEARRLEDILSQVSISDYGPRDYMELYGFKTIEEAFAFDDIRGDLSMPAREMIDDAFGKILADTMSSIRNKNPEVYDAMIYGDDGDALRQRAMDRMSEPVDSSLKQNLQEVEQQAEKTEEALEELNRQKERVNDVGSTPDSSIKSETGQVEELARAYRELEAAKRDANKQDASDGENISPEIKQLKDLQEKIGDVVKAIGDKTKAFTDEGTEVNTVVKAEMDDLQNLINRLGDVQEKINKIKDDLGLVDKTVDSVDTKAQDAEKRAEETKTLNAEQVDTPNREYALDTTLVRTNEILSHILSAVRGDDGAEEGKVPKLLSSLDGAVTELRNVANGIVQRQKDQQTDYSEASDRITKHRPELMDYARNAIRGTAGYTDDIQIGPINAMANGLVQVQAAVKDTEGVWRGVNVAIDDANKAILKKIDTDSKWIQGLNEAEAKLKAEAEAHEVNTEAVKQEIEAKEKSIDVVDDLDDKDTKKEKTFDEIKIDEVNKFKEYQKGITESIHNTDAFEKKLSDLHTSLNNVTDAEGLEAWRKSFSDVQDEISRYSKANTNKLTGEINNITKEAADAIKGAKTTIDPNVDLDGYNKQRAEQEKIAQAFRDVQIASDLCSSQIKNNQQADIAVLNKAKQEVLELVHAYRQQYGLVNTGGKGFSSSAVMRETTRYNQLNKYADDNNVKFRDTETFTAYKEAYDNLLKVRDKLTDKMARGIALTDHDVQEFNDAKKAAADYGKELDKLVAKANKLKASNYQIGNIGSDIDMDDALSRKQALSDFVTQMHDAREATIKFSDDYHKCTFKMKNEEGTWTKMTAVLDETSNKMYSTAGEVTKYKTSLGEFVGALKGEFFKLGKYMVASFGIEEVIQVVRTGIGYVKEIDDALTDLKKVTNETEAGYDRFLQKMSETAGVIGSTVSELTTMSAEWSKLGYNIQEAADLAESTAILLNVSEFSDATEASQALISTMQANNTCLII